MNKFTKYTIRDHGDFFEKHYWPYLDKSFPNYETFWSKHIAPYTNRNEQPNDVHPKEHIDEFMERIWAVHYSMFVQLGQSHEVFLGLKTLEDYLLKYDAIFYHLGMCINMQEDFFFYTYLLLNKQDPTKYLLPEKLSEDIFINKSKSYFEAHYKTDYSRYLLQGRTVSCVFHSKPQIENMTINLLINYSNREYFIKLNNVKDEIRSYRNRIEHNHKMGKIQVGDEFFVPKYKYLKEFEDWKAVRSKKPDIQNKFISQKLLAERLLTDLTQTFDSIWTDLIKLYDRLTVYAEYLKEPTDDICPRCKGKLEEIRILYENGGIPGGNVRSHDVSGRSISDLTGYSASGSAIADSSTNINDFFSHTTGISLVFRELVCKQCGFKKQIS